MSQLEDLILSILSETDDEMSAAEIAKQCQRRGSDLHSALDREAIRRNLQRMEASGLVISRLISSTHTGFVKGTRVWRIHEARRIRPVLSALRLRAYVL